MFWRERPGLMSIGVIPRGWVSIVRRRRGHPRFGTIRGLIGGEGC